MKIAVIGGGPAALESAVSARKFAPEAEIAIYSSENCLPYRRPALSGLLAAGKSMDPKTFFIKPESFLVEQKIEFHPGCTAVAIEGKQIRFADGKTADFDRLILACGSNAVRLPVPGADGENVFTLRSCHDLQQIVARLEQGVERAVVIGGGVLGLEVAESLLSRNIATVVLEAAPRLFANTSMSDEVAAGLLEKFNQISDLQIICGSSVQEIAPGKVTVAGGSQYPADMVIMAVGSRPDLALARSAGLQCGRGVKVDETMRSSREDIFAAGDLAEFNGRCFNLYMDAMAGGKIAGANAAGENQRFTATFSPVRFFGLGEKLVIN